MLLLPGWRLLLLNTFSLSEIEIYCRRAVTDVSSVLECSFIGGVERFTRVGYSYRAGA